MNNTTPLPKFKEFPKIARFSRNIIITEKIDGTNAQVYIAENGLILAGSRSRWLNLEQDNFMFCAWVQEHKEELLALGPGRHYGEWWGKGIQRGYDNHPRTFSLFNTIRWCRYGDQPQPIPTADPRQEKLQEMLPECCSLVPVLYKGIFSDSAVLDAMNLLKSQGSHAASSYKNPEGIVIYHTAANIAFKKTFEKDTEGKRV